MRLIESARTAEAAFLLGSAVVFFALLAAG